MSVHNRRHALLTDTGIIPFARPGVQPSYAPSRRVRIDHLDLTLRLFPQERRFEGEATIRFTPLALYAGKARFDLAEVEVEAVTDADGAAVPWEHADGQLSIDCGERHAVTVRYRGAEPSRGLYFTGPKPSAPDRQHMAWTQCQDENGHFVFPCHDQPGVKHPWTIRLEGPAACTLLSNGRQLSDEVVGERRVTTWEQAEPMPPYLFTAVAARLHTTTASWRDRPVRYLVPEGDQHAVTRAMAKTPLMIEAFSTITGVDYAWPRYDQVVVHDFIFGGMENVACTTMTDLLLVDTKAVLEWDPDVLVAHELAHQWFGDLVTCQDWSQGWLNESWATFMEAVWWEADRPEADAVWYRFQTMQDYLGEYSGRYRRSLVSYDFIDPLEVFDRHLYQKGSCVLWTLRAMLGEQAFWAGTRHYLQTHAHGTVHTRDFQRAMEQATGENLDGFFHQWVLAPSHPQLDIQLSTSDGLLVCAIRQTQSDEGAPQAYRFPLSIEVVTSTGTQSVKLPIAERERTWALPVDGEVQAVRIDPGLGVLATHSWKAPVSWLARTALDADPVIALRSAKALITEGSTPALDAARRALDTHPFWGVRASIATALGKRGGPDDLAALIDRLELDDDPRVQRAAAAALGSFRDARAADALIAALEEEPETWQLHGALLGALGATRDERAVAILRAHLATDSWAETVRSKALAGLASTRDAAVLDDLIAHSRDTHDDRVRGAAAAALAELGEHVEPTRTAVLERLVEMLNEPGFRTQGAAIGALGKLGDPRARGPLAQLERSAPDGRTRRMAYEAKLRVDRARDGHGAIEAMRRQLEELTEANHKLRARIDKLERPEG